MTRTVLRAGVVLVAGLLVGFTWPALAATLGLVTIVTTAWWHRAHWAGAAPYLVSGTLLVAASAAIVVITPAHDDPP